MKSDWELCRLGDIAEIVMGQSPPGDSYNADGIGLPLLNGPTEFGSRYPVPTQFTTAPIKVSRPGDVIFCVRGSTTGRMNTADQQYCLGRGVAAIRGATNEDTRFIHALLQSELPRLLAVVSGSTFPNLSRADLRGFEVLWPGLDHRQRIAGVLGALDDKIELDLRLAKDIERLAALHFCQLFPVIVGGEALGDHVEVVKGKSYKSDELMDSITALVTLKSIRRGGGYAPGGLKPYAGDYKLEQVVNAGEIVVAQTDLTQAADVIGQPAIVPGRTPYKTLVASLDLAIIRPRSDRISRLFVYHLLLSDPFQLHAYAYSNGSTVLHLAKEAIPSFGFELPEREQLAAFDRLVEPLFSQAETLESGTETLDAILKTLLPKLVSGAIRVPDSYDPDYVLGTVAEEAGAAV